MKSIRQTLAITLTILAFGMPTHAEGLTESQLLLREALMSSNKDYNQHKKKTNYEEFDRADDWSSRSVEGIVIDGNPRQELGKFLENTESTDKQELSSVEGDI